MAAPAAAHSLRPERGAAERGRLCRLVATVVGGLLVLGACSGGDDASGGTATTAGPALPATTTTLYVVPPIAPESVAEICAATDQILADDTKIGALLSPLLAADSSDDADKALLTALGGVKPIVEDAGTGYDRLAAVLPGALADDARTVRDATLTFYGAVTTATSMDSLVGVLQEAAGFSSAAGDAAARLDATTRKTCNKSLYNAG